MCTISRIRDDGWPAAGVAPVGRLRAYRASHGPECGPFSVCMQRADAQTVNFSHVTVDATRVRFAHQPGAPCDGRPVAVVDRPVEVARG